MGNKPPMDLYTAMNYMLGVGSPSGIDRDNRIQMLRGMNAPYSSARSGGSGSGGSRPGSGTPTPSPAAQPLNWSFPQYSQSWAFTPPTPTPVMPPPAFDAKSKTGYATPPKTSTGKKSTGGAFSFSSLLSKYGL